jgi:anhydro-N-acetylmuramic acid kinase
MILDNKLYKGIGVMSGTSLDGLDIAACEFWQEDKIIKFSINTAITIDYPKSLKNKLPLASKMSGFDLSILNVEYGRFIGKSVSNFISDNQFEAEFIASHGHTVFHQPEKGLTLQIGSGAEIAAQAGIKTVCDFRTSDVALGGQGAPLVPIGDELLFGEYGACLNLGGFANVSYSNNGKKLAFDICPVNIILNLYAKKLGRNFDVNGNFGRRGEIDLPLLSQLNKLGYYQIIGPKSLGWEYVESQIIPLINTDMQAEFVLRTFYEHIAVQIAFILNKIGANKLLITGGGAYNSFLIDLIQQKVKAKIVIPNKELIEFKEALIFALLGLLRINNQVNCLKEATGASENAIGGAIYE